MIHERRREAMSRVLLRTIVTECGCLLYTGSHSGTGRGGGYGRISIKGCTHAVHILSFEYYHGRKVRSGYFLDHLCEARNCWNPLHLEEVKQSVNEKRKHRRRKKAPVAIPDLNCPELNTSLASLLAAVDKDVLSVLTSSLHVCVKMQV